MLPRFFSWATGRVKDLAIITHAGGPGVMLTDILIQRRMNVPHQWSGSRSIVEKLHHGSSVSNPIDFSCYRRTEQLGEILDCVDNELDDIDGSVGGVWYNRYVECKQRLWSFTPENEKMQKTEFSRFFISDSGCGRGRPFQSGEESIYRWSKFWLCALKSNVNTSGIPCSWSSDSEG